MACLGGDLEAAAHGRRRRAAAGPHTARCAARAQAQRLRHTRRRVEGGLARQLLLEAVRAEIVQDARLRRDHQLQLQLLLLLVELELLLGLKLLELLLLLRLLWWILLLLVLLVLLLLLLQWRRY
jgi:hypothetical protein